MLKISTFILACASLVSCTHKAERVAVDPLSAVDGFVGEWQGTHKMLGSEEEYQATYSIKRVDDTLVWDFASTVQGGFTGHAVLRWDEERAQWAESWSDSSGDEETLSWGDWDTTTSTMHSSYSSVDWQDPAQKVVVHGTTTLGDGEFNYTMTYSYPDGKTVEVMWIHMTLTE